MDQSTITSAAEVACRLAQLYMDQGRADDAVSIYKDAFNSLQAGNKFEYSSVLRMLDHFARLMVADGRVQVAKETYSNVLLSFEKTFGAKSKAYLSAIFKMGTFLRHHDMLQEAVDLFRRCLEAFEEGHSHKLAFVLCIVNELGVIYTLQGQHKKAEKAYEQALQGAITVWGKDHISTITTALNLAAALKDQGKHRLASQTLGWAAYGLEKQWGTSHEKTVQAFKRLTELLFMTRKLREAERSCLLALGGCEAAFGTSHEHTLHSTLDLGVIYRDQGKFDNARLMLQKAIDGFESIDKCWSLVAVNCLATVYLAQGKLSVAESLFRETVTGFDSLLPENHVFVLIATFNLASLLGDQGNTRDSETQYNRAFQGFMECLGARHSVTLAVCDRLGKILETENRHVELESLYRSILYNPEGAESANLATVGGDHISLHFQRMTVL